MIRDDYCMFILYKQYVDKLILNLFKHAVGCALYYINSKNISSLFEHAVHCVFIITALFG